MFSTTRPSSDDARSAFGDVPSFEVLSFFALSSGNGSALPSRNFVGRRRNWLRASSRNDGCALPVFILYTSAVLGTNRLYCGVVSFSTFKRASLSLVAGVRT